jgi:hypothetical protein
MGSAFVSQREPGEPKFYQQVFRGSADPEVHADEYEYGNGDSGWKGRPPPFSIVLTSYRGNVKRQRPYQEGPPCSQCPDGYHCENALCGESARESAEGGSGRSTVFLDPALCAAETSGMRPPGALSGSLCPPCAATLAS